MSGPQALFQLNPLVAFPRRDQSYAHLEYGHATQTPLNPQSNLPRTEQFVHHLTDGRSETYALSRYMPTRDAFFTHITIT